jgi:DNA-binding SARP family transcriptional activator
MAESLRLALLGRPEITYHGVPLTDFRSAKAQALLCYLAATGGVHARLALATLFWAEDLEEKAQNSLRVVLSNLNKLLPGFLTVERTSVAFTDAAATWPDLHEFDARLATHPQSDAQDAPRLEAALALYRGEFLADLYIDGAPQFEEWLLRERTRRREQAAAALRTLAAIYVRSRDPARAITIYQRLLALEPWDEAAHRALMVL